MKSGRTAVFVTAAVLCTMLGAPLFVLAAGPFNASLTAVSPTYSVTFNFTPADTNAKILIDLAQGTSWTNLNVNVGVGPGVTVSFQISDPSGISQGTGQASGAPSNLQASNPVSGEWTLAVTSASSIPVGQSVPVTVNVVGSFVSTTTTSSTTNPLNSDFLILILVAIVVVAVGGAAFVMLRKGGEPVPATVPGKPMAPTPSGGTTVYAPGTQVMQPGTKQYFAALELPSGQVLPMTSMTQDFGRGEFESLVPKEVSNIISRRHFQISFSARDKKFYIEDIGSTNGTMLNGNDIRGKGKVPLNPGDVVSPADVINLKFKG